MGMLIFLGGFLIAAGFYNVTTKRESTLNTPPSQVTVMDDKAVIESVYRVQEAVMTPFDDISTSNRYPEGVEASVNSAPPKFSQKEKDSRIKKAQKELESRESALSSAKKKFAVAEIEFSESKSTDKDKASANLEKSRLLLAGAENEAILARKELDRLMSAVVVPATPGEVAPATPRE